MKKNFLFIFGLTFFFFFGENSFAAPPTEWKKNITFTYEITEFSLPLSRYPEFFVQKTEKILPQETVCKWENSAEKIEKKKKETEKKWEINESELKKFIETYIVPNIDRDAENVRIYRDENGKIAFEGAARFGQKLDIVQTIALTKKAIMTNGVQRVKLPVQKMKPRVDVEDEDLRNMGITELIAVGESDFSGSTWDRMKNIQVGANTMNGVLIPQGEIMSFNEHLGSVTAKEGYVPELVILGPKVEKEYGGGLCQVSSTAFRMALLAGLPIVERWQHSFAVHYYEPWGTDATIYPGAKDMRFKNNTDGALLVQTVMLRDERQLRFHLYGTRDKRKTELFFSGTYNPKGVLPPKYETSTNLAPGEIKRFSGAVRGFDVDWYRVVIPDTEKAREEKDQPLFHFFSRYEPRGEWVVRGVSPEEKPAGEEDVLHVEGSSI